MKLKACRCGGAPREWSNRKGLVCMCCIDCGKQSSWMDSFSEAVRDWNLHVAGTRKMVEEMYDALESSERVFQLYNRLDLSDMDSFRDWDSAFDEAQSKVKTALAKVRGEE